MLLACTRLRMAMTWMDMLPQSDPVTREFKRITQEFDGGLSNIVIGIEGADEQSVRATATEIEAALQPLINDRDLRRVTWQLPMEFFREHGFMLTEEKDLKRIPDLVHDLNLVPFLSAYNDNLDRTFVGDEDKLTENERAAIASLDGLEWFVRGMHEALRADSSDSSAITASLDRFWIGNNAYVSPDGTMLLMTLQPWVALDSVVRTVELANALDEVLAPVKARHPDQTIRTAGMHIVCRDEMRAGTEDSFVSTIVAFVLILLMLMVALRAKAAPLLAGLVLIVGIVWDMGLAGLVIGRLNMMTAFCAVYLVGLGIDFSIHFMHGYNEQRHKRLSIDRSIELAFAQNGQGILTGGLTTAIAFFALLFTDFDMFREMGFVSGCGVILCLLANFTVLPSILVLRDRFAEARGRYAPPPESVSRSRIISGYAAILVKGPVVVVLLCLVVAGVLFHYGLKNFSFDGNMMNLEAKGLESIALQDTIVSRFHQSNYSNIFTVPTLDSAYKLTMFLQDRKTVGLVESPSQFCPPPAVQNERRPFLERIGHLITRDLSEQEIDISRFREEIERLEANVIEMSQTAYMSLLDRVSERADRMTGLDSSGMKVAPGIFAHLLTDLDKLEAGTAALRLFAYQRIFTSCSRALVLRMAGTGEITWDMVPPEIGAGMLSRDGREFLVSVYPRSNIWEELIDSPYMRMLHDKVPNATGITSFMAVLYRCGREEGMKAVVLSFVAIVVLLLLDFRSVKFAALSCLPLLFAVGLLVGLYALFGVQFNLMSFMGIPLILGIGIDDGVHVCHRFRSDPGKPVPILVGAIGRAIFLTSATTMIAFGSLLTGRFRGNVALGLVLFLGVGLCFVMSITLLPALLQLVGNKGQSGKNTRRHP